MLRAAVYARYSTGLQRATSIDDQVSVCRDAAPRFGCVVLDQHVYTDQEISGNVTQRPGYTQLLAAAKRGEFDAILVEGQDRLWRDQGEMHAALKRLRFWEVRVFAVSTGTDLTDKTGKLMASVMGWKDEIFADDLREKTRRGMIGQIRRGLSAGGHAYGYRSEPVCDPTKRDVYGRQMIVGSRRIVDPSEAAIVLRIFKMYAAGLSAKTIARRLNEEGVAPPRGRHSAPAKRGWTWTTIAGSPRRSFGILNNPIYIGQLVWNRTQKVRDPDTGKRVMRMRPKDDWVCVPVPDLRIVPDALWYCVQQQQAAKRRPHEARAKGRPLRHMLSGLLRCAVCGGSYVIKSRKYYGCATNLNQGPAVCSNYRLVRRDILETVVLRLITDKVFTAEAVAYLTRRVSEILAQPRTGRRDALLQDHEQACQTLENIKKAIRQGLVTATTKAMLEETEARLAAAEAALREADQTAVTTDTLPRLVNQYLRDLRSLLGRDPDRARVILQKLIGEVKLEPNEQGLVAVLRGNIWGILSLEERYCTTGAGRGISSLPNIGGVLEVA